MEAQRMPRAGLAVSRVGQCMRRTLRQAECSQMSLMATFSLGYTGLVHVPHGRADIRRRFRWE